MTRLEELQKIINAYYQKGGDYGGAAKAFGDIDGWNNLVRERDRLRDSGSKKPVHKTIDTSPGIGPGTPRAHYTMNPIVVSPKKRQCHKQEKICQVKTLKSLMLPVAKTIEGHFNFCHLTPKTHCKLPGEFTLQKLLFCQMHFILNFIVPVPPDAHLSPQKIGICCMHC